MHTISIKALLAIYLLLPLVLVIIAVDHFVFHDALKHFLPHRPETLLWYALIFNLPHILTSFFGFADKAYLNFYRMRLGIGIPIIAALAFLLPWLNIFSAIYALILYTLYRNVSQQTGITTSLMQYRDWKVQLWRFTNILLGLYLYFLVYPPVAMKLLRDYALPITITLFVFSCALTLLIVRKSKTQAGVLYAFGTAGIAGVGIFSFFTGYLFFVATTLRVIHDLTAFIFYITHDRNRNREVMHNVLYRFILPDTQWFIVGIPLLAILLTYVAQAGGTSMVIQAFFFVSVTHFYIEGFMWKNGTPHRAQIAFQV